VSEPWGGELITFPAVGRRNVIPDHFLRYANEFDSKSTRQSWSRCYLEPMNLKASRKILPLAGE
jgi:hypothetical protein